MARRNDHTRDELKALIIQAAWDIAGREGFEALTARRIATEIGYAPGTIYNLFESMDDLYLQVNRRTLDDLYKVLSSAACNDSNKTPTQNMKSMAALYMKFAQQHRAHWLMLFNHRLPEGRKAEAWYQEKIDRLFDPLEKLLDTFFSNKQRDKQKTAARILWSSVHGLCFLHETGKIPLVSGKAATQDMASYLIDTFVAGIQ